MLWALGGPLPGSPKPSRPNYWPVAAGLWLARNEGMNPYSNPTKGLGVRV